jgi:hypothetical protein
MHFSFAFLISLSFSESTECIGGFWGWLLNIKALIQASVPNAYVFETKGHAENAEVFRPVENQDCMANDNPRIFLEDCWFATIYTKPPSSHSLPFEFAVERSTFAHHGSKILSRSRRLRFAAGTPRLKHTTL